MKNIITHTKKLHTERIPLRFWPPIDKYHTQAHQNQRDEESRTYSLSQDECSAEKHAKDRGKKRKGMKETDWVAMDQVKPDQITNEGHNNTLIENGKPCHQRKP